MNVYVYVYAINNLKYYYAPQISLKSKNCVSEFFKKLKTCVKKKSNSLSTNSSWLEKRFSLVNGVKRLVNKTKICFKTNYGKNIVKGSTYQMSIFIFNFSFWFVKWPFFIKLFLISCLYSYMKRHINLLQIWNCLNFVVNILYFNLN